MPFLALVAALTPQEPSHPAEAMPITVALSPAAADRTGGPRWSPKGATVLLTAGEQGLTGSFRLGPDANAAIQVRLQCSPGAAHYDQLWIDADRDGALSEGERLTTTPKEQRGKWWSSFAATVTIPVPAAGAMPAATRPYPLNLWFVVDPAEPAAAPALRWSRRGWHEGQTVLGGHPVHIWITEMVMDGVFDQRDAWSMAHDATKLPAADHRSMEQHIWLDGVAWRPTAIDPHGRSLTFVRCDPGITEAEEQAKADIYKADREARRAPIALSFQADLAAAMAQAKRDGKRVFVDFQTTWCGPCRQMEQFVYTAADVVTAAADTIAVKLDGDIAKDLVKQYQVGGYPTMLLLDGDGNVLRREVGYRGVAAMVKFFAK